MILNATACINYYETLNFKYELHVIFKFTLLLKYFLNHNKKDNSFLYTIKFFSLTNEKYIDMIVMKYADGTTLKKLFIHNCFQLDW